MKIKRIAALALACAMLSLSALAETNVLWQREYLNDGESVTLTASEDGAVKWTYTSVTKAAAELTGVNVYDAGDVVLINNSEEGLIALNRETGAEVWRLSAEDAALGAGNAFCGDGDAVYVTGYYGPNAPVKVSLDGKILWRADASIPGYWPASLTRTSDGVRVRYESWGDGDDFGGWALYDAEDGKLLAGGESGAYTEAFFLIGQYEPGTAGSSLKAVRAAAGLLAALRYTEISDDQAVTDAQSEFAALSAENQGLFDQRFGDVSGAAGMLLSADEKNREELLSEAGITDCDLSDYDTAALDQFVAAVNGIQK